MNLRLLVCTVTAAIGVSASAQVIPTITTFAGSGSPNSLPDGGPSGDGGPATQSDLGYALKVAADGQGNIYFIDFGFVSVTEADQVNQYGTVFVRRVDAATGTITTIAGAGSSPAADGMPAANAYFPYGWSLACDQAGNVFLGEFYDYTAVDARIWRIDAATGMLSTYAGGVAPTQFYSLGDCEGIVQPIPFPSGDGGPATSAVIVSIEDMAVDPDGNLHFCDRTTIRKIDAATGIITSVAGNSAVSFDDIEPGDGNCTGLKLGTYSGDGGAATSATLVYPLDLAFDSAGNLFFAEFDVDFGDGVTNQRIRRVDAATGIITAYAGDGSLSFSGDGGPAIAAGLNMPRGLAFDSSDNLYFADMINNVVRRVNAATGTISTVVGTPQTYGYSGDGGPALAAVLSSPYDLAIDADGNVFIADADNLRVRKVVGLTNAPPTAAAGPDQSIHATTVITLNGSASFDDNTPSNALTYSWSFLSLPAGSTANLSNPTAATPSFIADRVGTYAVELVVTDDAGLASEPDIVYISSTNMAPTADAGPAVVAVVGDFVTLNGSASSDPELDPLTFDWEMTDSPRWSCSYLFYSNTATPIFFADRPGTYTFSLVVSDPLGPSLADTVTITVITGADFAENKLMEVLATLDSLPDSQVTNKGNRKAFKELLTHAIRSLQRGNISNACQKMEDALERTDGCVLRGQPDSHGNRRDWILNCTAQTSMFNDLTEALDAVDCNWRHHWCW